MTLRAGPVLALAAAGLFSLSGLDARTQTNDYGRLPTLENSLGPEVMETLEKLNLGEGQRHTVRRIMELEAAQLEQTRANPDLSVAKRLVQEQRIRNHAHQQIVSILTGEQRERLTKLMLKKMVKRENHLNDY